MMKALPLGVAVMTMIMTIDSLTPRGQLSISSGGKTLDFPVSQFRYRL